jgi:hypothetical protein
LRAHVLKSVGRALGIMASSFAASSGFNLQEATGPRAPHHLAGLCANMEMCLHARFFSFRFFAPPAVPGDSTLHWQLARHLLLGICMHCASAGCRDLQSHAATCLSPLQESDASLVPSASAAAVLNSPLATGGTLLVAPDYGHEHRASNGWLEVMSPPENGLCSLATENVKAYCVVPPALSGLVVHDELLPGLNTDMYRQARKLLQGMPPPKSVFERSEGRLCVAGKAAAAIAAVMSLEAPVQPAKCAQHHPAAAADNAGNRENDMGCARDAANVDQNSEVAAAHAREASPSREGLPAKGLPALSAFASRGRQPLGEEVHAALLIPHAARYLFCEELRSALEQSERGASDVNADRGKASVEAFKANSSSVWSYSGMSLALDSSNDARRSWPLRLPHQSPDGGCAICERINEVAFNATRVLLDLMAIPTEVARLKTVLKSLKSTVQSARLYLAEHHIPAGVIAVNAGDRRTVHSGVLHGGEERVATVQALCASVAAVGKLSSSLTCDGMAAQTARDVEVRSVDVLQLPRHVAQWNCQSETVSLLPSDRSGCRSMHKIF